MPGFGDDDYDDKFPASREGGTFWFRVASGAEFPFRLAPPSSSSILLSPSRPNDNRGRVSRSGELVCLCVCLGIGSSSLIPLLALQISF